MRLRWPFASVSLSSCACVVCLREMDELLKINITFRLKNGLEAPSFKTRSKVKESVSSVMALAELQKTSLLGSIFVFSSIRRLFVIFTSCLCFHFVFFSCFLPLLRSMPIHSSKFLFILCRSTQCWLGKRTLDFGTMYLSRDKTETAQHTYISL